MTSPGWKGKGKKKALSAFPLLSRHSILRFHLIFFLNYSLRGEGIMVSIRPAEVRPPSRPSLLRLSPALALPSPRFSLLLIKMLSNFPQKTRNISALPGCLSLPCFSLIDLSSLHFPPSTLLISILIPDSWRYSYFISGFFCLNLGIRTWAALRSGHATRGEGRGRREGEERRGGDRGGRRERRSDLVRGRGRMRSLHLSVRKSWRRDSLLTPSSRPLSSLLLQLTPFPPD